MALVVTLATACGASGHTGQPAFDGPATKDLVAAQIEGYLNDLPAPPANAFQKNILTKKTLTYADYQSAVQAAADCARQKLPGYEVTVVPQKDFPQLLGISFGRGGTGEVSDGISAPSLGPGSDSPSAAQPPSVPPSSAPMGGSSPMADGGDSPIDDAGVKFGDCMVEYMVYVQARWTSQQVLGASTMNAERPEFLECLISAGVRIAPDADFAQILTLLQSRSWGASLSPAQGAQADACLSKYAEFINTIS